MLGTRNPVAGKTAADAVILGVDGTTLHLGFTDNEHLEAFKQHCAGIIRSGIQERFDVTIGYKPWVGDDRINEGRQLFGGSAPVAHAASSTTEPTPAPAPIPEPEPGLEPTPAPAPNPETELAPEPAPEPIPDSAPPYEEPPFEEPPFEEPPLDEPPAPPAPSPEPEPAPAPEPEQRAAPTFTRYGESVVREVLGAKFVGEQPLQ